MLSGIPSDLATVQLKLLTTSADLRRQCFVKRSCWFKTFLEGKYSIEDEPPMDFNFKNRDHVLSDRRLRIRMIAEMFNLTRSTVHQILTPELGIKKKTNGSKKHFASARRHQEGNVLRLFVIKAKACLRLLSLLIRPTCVLVTFPLSEIENAIQGTTRKHLKDCNRPPESSPSIPVPTLL